MGFGPLLVASSTPSEATANVFLMSYWLKMLRVDAATIAAEVI
jgi:hypothetical protein